MLRIERSILYLNSLCIERQFCRAIGPDELEGLALVKEAIDKLQHAKQLLAQSDQAGSDGGSVNATIHPFPALSPIDSSHRHALPESSADQAAVPKQSHADPCAT